MLTQWPIFGNKFNNRLMKYEKTTYRKSSTVLQVPAKLAATEKSHETSSISHEFPVP